MTAIIDEILKHLPKDADISETSFEGANIILYTKNKKFFLDQSTVIRDVVSIVKKRIELRPDPAITLDVEKAEKEIKKLHSYDTPAILSWKATANKEFDCWLKKETK